MHLAALALLAAGCAGADDGTGDRTVTDSAGIEIVTVAVPEAAGVREGDGAAATPLLDLGVADGEDPLIFSGIVGAVRLSDGRIVVANGATSELRFFGPDGAHLATVGRSGEGPGEFRALAWLGTAPGDTLLVYDARLRRFSRLDARGTFIDAFPVSGVFLPYPSGLLDARTVGAWQFTGELSERPGVSAAPMEVGTIDMAGGAFTSIDVVPGAEEALVTWRGRPTAAFRPFGPSGDAVAGPGLVHVLASSDDAAIRMYDASGRLLRILRVRTEAAPVDAARIEAWADSWIEAFSTGDAMLEERWRHGFRETPPADRVPLFRSLATDARGNVCAERYPLTWTSPVRWWCFSPDGRFVRAFELPAGLLRRGPYPHFDPGIAIGDDVVLGVWQDSLRVEHVRMYAIPSATASSTTASSSSPRPGRGGR